MEQTLKKIHIPRYKEVYLEYLKTNPKYLNINEIKGGVIDSEIYKYKKLNFVIYIEKDDDMIEISIRREDKIKNVPCLYIKIDKSYKKYNSHKVAYIENISYYKDCVQLGLNYPGGGSILLKLAIKYLTENKQKFDINRIFLTDTSTMYCEGISNKFVFPVLYSLVHGDTWYGKYGFKPYNPEINEPDMELYDKYKNNKKIILETKIKNIKHEKLLKYFIKYNKIKDPRNIEKYSNKFREKYNDLYINNFFEDHIKNFDIHCKILSKIYLKLFKKLDLHNFHKHAFYLDI